MQAFTIQPPNGYLIRYLHTETFPFHAFSPTTSWSFMSVSPPISPALAQNFERCLVPESQRIVTILWPGPSSLASLTAATPLNCQLSHNVWIHKIHSQLTALLLPTKIPSFSTNHLAICITSPSFTLYASSIVSLPSSKFAVTRFSPIPSTIVSTCCRRLVPSLSFASNMTPYFTRLYSPLPSGSAKTIFSFGNLLFKNLATPVIVPPVPAPATKASRCPEHWA